MKKTISLVLALLLVGMAVVPALAEDSRTLSFSGEVVAGSTVTVAAPFGGRVEDYTLRAGDMVEAGDVIFTLDSTKVYAPADGTVTGLRAQEGDTAEYVQERYGALMYLEPASRYTVQTNTSGAYDDNANKIVYAGEMVYLVSQSTKNRSATGVITAVDGSAYTVEVQDGNLNINERVNIYRRADHSYESKIGAGTTARISPLVITAQGSVLKLHVQEGDAVQRGDMLAEMVTGDLYGLVDIEKEVISPAQGIVASISATAGSDVVAEQVMASVYPRETLQVSAELHEMDLQRVAIGDKVTIELLGGNGEQIPGTVAGISALSITESGDAEYNLYVDFDADAEVRIGMSATVYLK